MNYKEALEEIKYQLKHVGDYDVVYWDCIPTEILNVCAKALEKQIPKQIKKVKFEHLLAYSETYFCSNCGGSVWQIKSESKYCFRCGHKLDWEVKE